MTGHPRPTGRPTAAAPQTRPDYGIDAPDVVRGMFTAGGVGLLAAAGAAVAIGTTRWYGVAAIALASLVAAYGVGMGTFMVYSSRVGKLRTRDRLLGLVPWAGAESVLDVGCGRGLMLVGAARRLTTGRAVGIDLWQASDQADNRPDATAENARREGVDGRVEVRTADMRELPFPVESFDVVVSHWAVHNLYAADDRAVALAEMARVLKPGGVLILADIRHHAEYLTTLAGHGLTDLRHVGGSWKRAILTVLTFGSFQPAALYGRKPVPAA